jgi:hypothetical protein
MRKFAALYPERFYILVYDDLIMNPEQEMRNLCRFLDIDFDPVLLRPTIHGTPWGGNSWSNESFTAIDSKPLHQWKKEISKREIRLLNKHFGSLIDTYFSGENAGGSLFIPFQPSEYKPWVYLGNRILFYWSFH